MKAKTKKLMVAIIAVLLAVICICVYIDEIIAGIAGFRLGAPQEHGNYAGVLRIPSVDIELPCIETKEDDRLAELAVDAPSCAAKIWYGKGLITEGIEWGNWLIGDHDWQGFFAIMELEAGDTAYLADVQGIETKYVVTEMFEGYIDADGTPVDGEGEIFFDYDPEHVILMTCYPDADVPAERGDRRFFVYLELAE